MLSFLHLANMADEDEVSESCFADLSSYLKETNPGKYWSVMLSVLEKLKLWSKLKENRSKISEIDVHLVKRLIDCCYGQLQSLSDAGQKDLRKCLMVVTEAFRFLRNCCAEVSQNQEYIMNAGNVEQVTSVLCALLKPKFQESEQDRPLISAAIKSGIQLLGNVVVGNDVTAEFVWQKCFPSFFLCVLSCADYTCRECLCMVIYNCLNPQHRSAIVEVPEGCRILAQILHLCTEQKELEWGYFVLDSLLFNHLPEMYQGLHFDASSRIILLELLNARLSETSSSNSSSLSTVASGPVPEDAVLFLAEQFVSNSKMAVLRMSEDQGGSDTLEALVASRLLSVLCTASALQDHYRELINNMPLLQIALDLLRESSKPEHKASFSNDTSLPNGADSGELSPSHGFKRDLVQLLGNMSYQHRPNQDKIRELGGIAVILDHCNIDDHNPYICQWAIFAVRNLLDNNLENQTIVAAMDRRGLGDVSKLRQFGVDVVEQNGRIKIVPTNETK